MLAALLRLNPVNSFDEEIVKRALLGTLLLLGLLGLRDHFDGFRYKLERRAQRLARLLLEGDHSHPKEHVFVLRREDLDLHVEGDLISALIHNRLELDGFRFYERDRLQRFAVVYERRIQSQPSAVVHIRSSGYVHAQPKQGTQETRTEETLSHGRAGPRRRKKGERAR